MIRINLIPPEFAEAQAKREQQVLLISVGAILFALMLVVWGLKETQAKGLQNQIIQAETTLRSYQAIVDQIKEIENKKKVLVAKRDVILGLNKSRLSFPVFFEDLLPLIPSDVWLLEIKMDRQTGTGGDYKLHSKALSNFALATWLTNLQQSTHFSNVKLDKISYETPSDDKETVASLSFMLTFSYQHQGPMPLSENN